MADGATWVLMVSLPLQGHITPMLRFAECLASKGVCVTLATTEVGRDRLLNYNSPTTQNGVVLQTCRVHLEFFPDGLDLEMDRDDHLDLLLLEALPLRGSKNLSHLITNLTIKNGRKFSCVIENPFVPWVADVAGQHGIPCAMLYVQAFALCATYNHFYKDVNKDLNFQVIDCNETVKFPGLPLLDYKDLPTFVIPSSPYHFRKLMLDSVESFKKVRWVLGNSFYELEANLLQSMETSSNPILLPVGPLVPPIMLIDDKDYQSIAGVVDSKEDSCIQWLNAQAPSSVIYIAFGSITVLKPEQMEQIATALETLNRPFLWVVKSQEEEFLTKNKGSALAHSSEGTNCKGMVVSWCRQEKVLMHPAIACFISHCGWNSTLEAIMGGVPIVAFPGWTDQPTNAKLIVEVFKIGLRMTPGEDGIVSQMEVGRCISEITNGPAAEEIKNRVMELKEAGKKAIAHGGSSDQNVDRFINEFIGN